MLYVDISPKSLGYNKWPLWIGRYKKKYYSVIKAVMYRVS